MRKRSSIIVALALVFSIGLSLLPMASAQQQAVTETEAQRSVRQEIQQRRINIAPAMEERQERMAEQLRAIPNEARREAVTRISASITAINNRMVDHYLEVVGQIEGVFLRLVQRLDQADSAGTPTGSARDFVIPARDAITAARSSVTAQSGVLYNLEAGDDGVLRIEMQNTRNAFKADLDKIRDSLKSARSAVAQIIIEFNKAQPK